MSNKKVIKLKNLPVENPQYSSGVFWFGLCLACIIELLILLGIV